MSNLINTEKLRQCYEQQRHSASLMLIPVIYCQLDEMLPIRKTEVASGLFANIDNNWEAALGAKKHCSIAVIKVDDVEQWLARQDAGIRVLDSVVIACNDVYKGEKGIVTDIIHHEHGKDYYHVELERGGYGRWLREDIESLKESEVIHE